MRLSNWSRCPTSLAMINSSRGEIRFFYNEKEEEEEEAIVPNCRSSRRKASVRWGKTRRRRRRGMCKQLDFSFQMANINRSWPMTRNLSFVLGERQLSIFFFLVSLSEKRSSSWVDESLSVVEEFDLGHQLTFSSSSHLVLLVFRSNIRCVFFHIDFFLRLIICCQ